MVAGTLLSIATFVVAILSIIAITIVAGIASRQPGRIFQFLMLLIVAASVGTILLSGRVLTVGSQGLEIGSSADIAGGLWSKVLLATVIGCAVAACIAWFVFPPTRRKMLSRFTSRSQQSPNDIAYAFLIYYVAFSLLPLLFAPFFDFHVSLVYPFFIFLALLMWSQVSSIDPVDVVKQGMLLIVVGSLLAALVWPELATQPGYLGLVPGFNQRLWGVTASANSLGSVACVLLVLEVAEPFKRRAIHWFVLAGAVTALVLSQSKTAIVAGLIGSMVIVGWRLASDLLHANNSRPGRVPLSASIVAIIAILLTVGGFWLMFSDSNLLTVLSRRLESRAVVDLSTASGRTLIWDVAIKGGMDSPLFGQGLGFWSLESRLQTGLNGAVHAHNMFLQVFSRSGVVGLAAFLAFFWLLLRYSIRAAIPTRGGSIGVMVAFLMRAMVEVPIQPNSVLGAEFFAMVAYLFYVMDRGPKSAIAASGAKVHEAKHLFLLHTTARPATKL